MKVAVCTHGGAGIGLGHVRRCLSLAQALSGRGASVTFLVNDDPGIAALISPSGYPVRAVDEHLSGLAEALLAGTPPDAIVADSYDLTTADFASLRAIARLAVIDDLADRALPADVIVNSTPHADASAYRASPAARLLLGPSYALLRPEFADARPREIRRAVRRVLVTLGGGDPRGWTADVVRWVRACLPEAALDVVVGPLAKDSPAVEGENVSFHRSPGSIRDLMLAADLAVAAGGQTTYELAATGTPSVIVAMAGNQIAQSRAWDSAGALWYASDIGDRGLPETVSAMVRALADDPGARGRMSERGRALVDGRGAPRVAEAVLAV